MDACSGNSFISNLLPPDEFFHQKGCTAKELLENGLKFQEAIQTEKNPELRKKMIDNITGGDPKVSVSFTCGIMHIWNSSIYIK